MTTPEYILLPAMLVASVIDIQQGRIPNTLTYSAFLVVLALADSPQKLFLTLGASLCVSLPMLALYGITSGRGLGLGDVKLAVVIGAAMGIERGLTALALAFVVGAIVGGLGLALGYFERRTRIAFAPYLTLGVLTLVMILPKWNVA